MTVTSIKKVAIIGAGPSGLVTLKELLHTAKNGESTILNPNADNQMPSEAAFDEIVVFEQSDHIGGVWQHSKETDVSLPKHAGEHYSKPEYVRPHLTTPSADKLAKSNVQTPIEIGKDIDRDLLYSRSAVYDNLFTNIPNHVMKFSTSFDDEIKLDQNSKKFEPFAFHQNVKNYLDAFAENDNLKKYVRFNSVVEKIFKTQQDDKWNVVVCKLENGIQKWYQEKFDAVAICVGRFNVPFIPKIDGLKDFNNTHPGVIVHAKEFRSSTPLKDKKVLVIGLSISAIDILQYLVPICKETHVSGNNKMGFGDNKERLKKSDWVEDILADDSLNLQKHSRIERFEGDKVYFEDGSVESGFDQILFCTGYHNYFPFLDIPENKSSTLVNVTSGYDGIENFAQTKISNVFLYVFTIEDPTIAHIGVAHNPLFFLASEAEAIAVAGVWSGTKKLPPKEEQWEWMQNRLEGKIKGFQYYDENQIRDFISTCYKLGPHNRYNMLPRVPTNAVESSKTVLHDLFYKFSNKELFEDDPNCNYNGQ